MYKACFVDIPYKRVKGKDIYKFTKLKEAYESKGYKTLLTENIEDVMSIEEEENVKIVLFWHLSSSRWKSKIISPDDIELILNEIETNFHKKYGVTDHPEYRKAAQLTETERFNMVYSWEVFYRDFE